MASEGDGVGVATQYGDDAHEKLTKMGGWYWNTRKEYYSKIIHPMYAGPVMMKLDAVWKTQKGEAPNIERQRRGLYVLYAGDVRIGQFEGIYDALSVVPTK